jgi:hypothetical protein
VVSSFAQRQVHFHQSLLQLQPTDLGPMLYFKNIFAEKFGENGVFYSKQT